MSAAAVTDQRMSFKPSWMGSGGGTYGRGGGGGGGGYRDPHHGGGDGGGKPLLTLANEHGHGITTIGAAAGVLAPPKLSRNKFSREELLALHSVLVLDTAPDALVAHFEEFVCMHAQAPVTMSAMNELEDRLFHQQGINSSKALSALSAEQRHILGLAPMGQQSDRFTTPWSERAQGMRGGYRGGRGGGETGMTRGRYVTPRGGRGGAMIGATTITRTSVANDTNTRAQGLYDPRDPRDRPRPRQVLDPNANGDGERGGGTTRGRGSWRGRGQYGGGYEQDEPAWMCDDNNELYDDLDQVDEILRMREHFKNDKKHVEPDQRTKDTLSALMGRQIGGEEAPKPVVKEQLMSKRSATPDEFKQAHDFAEALVDSFAFDDEPAAPPKQVLAKPPPQQQQQPPQQRHRPQTFEQAAPNTVQQILATHRQSDGEKDASAKHLQHLLQAAGIGDVPKPSPPVAQQARPQQQQQQPPQPPKIAAPPPVAKPTTPPTYAASDQWIYVDPNGLTQGPFPSPQMAAWCEAGYFREDLQLKRKQDTHPTALVDLLKHNGNRPPFVRENGNKMDAKKSSKQAKGPKAPPSVEDKMAQMKTEQEAAQQRVKLQIQQQETERLATERHDELERVKRDYETKQQQLQMELERKTRESQHMLLQLETERKRQHQMQESNQQQQVQHAQAQQLQQRQLEERLRAQQREMAQRQQQSQLKQQADEEAGRRERQQRAAQEHLQRQQAPWGVAESEPAPRPTGRQISLSELFGLKPEPASKAQPQASVWGADSRTSGGNIASIQEEEERQERVDRERRTQQQQEQQQAGGGQSGGAWAGARQQAGWQTHQNCAWTTKTAPQQRKQQAQQPQGFWEDEPSVAGPTPAAAAPPPKTQQRQQANGNSKKSTNNNRSTASKNEASVKSLLTGKLDKSDGFVDWVIKSCRSLDASVDGEMFAAFLNEVDNPADVEDYLMSYFRDTAKTREFMTSYLKRRSEHRQRQKQVESRDDLTSAVSASHHAPPAEAEFTQVAGRKGQTKKSKKIDGKSLGFSAGAASTRLNRGDIDTDFN